MLFRNLKKTLKNGIKNFRILQQNKINPSRS